MMRKKWPVPWTLNRILMPCFICCNATAQHATASARFAWYMIGHVENWYPQVAKGPIVVALTYHANAAVPLIRGHLRAVPARLRRVLVHSSRLPYAYDTLVTLDGDQHGSIRDSLPSVVRIPGLHPLLHPALRVDHAECRYVRVYREQDFALDTAESRQQMTRDFLVGT